MITLSEEERALKELIENSEEVYRNFQNLYRSEISLEPRYPGDTRIHRIEELWHNMRKEVDNLQTQFVQAQIEASEEDAYQYAFPHFRERRRGLN